MSVTGFGYTGTAKLTATDLTAFLASLLTSGVCLGYLDELAVSESSPQAMSVDVAAGAFIVGKANFFNFVRNDVSLTLAIAAADPTNPRWDLVVVTRDAAGGASSIEVVQGTPAGSPADPALSDTETEKQIAIARVVVGAAAASITDSDITDLRTYSASRLNEGWSSIVKAADETVTTSTTLQDDDDFSIQVEANSKYLLRLLLKVNVGTAAGLKYQFTVPSGATYDGLHVSHNGSTPEVVSCTEAGTALYSGSSGATTLLIEVLLETGGSAGAVTLQWAESASSGTITIYGGSALEYKKVA
jgi:hypothetical protein